jgi:hypothetical protein
MGSVFAEHDFKVPPRHDQHPVEALSPTAPDPSFDMRIGSWRQQRRQDHPGALGSDNLVKALCGAFWPPSAWGW